MTDKDIYKVQHVDQKDNATVRYGCNPDDVTVNFNPLDVIIDADKQLYELADSPDKIKEINNNSWLFKITPKKIRAFAKKDKILNVAPEFPSGCYFISIPPQKTDQPVNLGIPLSQLNKYNQNTFLSTTFHEFAHGILACDSKGSMSKPVHQAYAKMPKVIDALGKASFLAVYSAAAFALTWNFIDTMEIGLPSIVSKTLMAGLAGAGVPYAIKAYHRKEELFADNLSDVMAPDVLISEAMDVYESFDNQKFSELSGAQYRYLALETNAINIIKNETHPSNEYRAYKSMKRAEKRQKQQMANNTL